MNLLPQLLLYISCATAFPTCLKHKITPTQLPALKSNQEQTLNRKQFLTVIPFLPTIANAGIDPNALKALPVEGDSSGAATRLRSLSAEEDAAKSKDLVDIPFENLPSGVSYREYRAGSGDACEFMSVAYRKSNL